MKRQRLDKEPLALRDSLREKWKRELLKRRVDAKGMEPIRLRVHALCKRRLQAQHQHS